MRRRCLSICAFAFILAAVTPNHAFADLISVVNPGITSADLGSANTLVTIHENGSGDGFESGCINQLAAFTPCLNNAATQVPGGDNVGLNQILNLSTTQNLFAVVNTKTAGGSVSGYLTDLYLTFTGAGGTYTAEYLGPDLLLSSGIATFGLIPADLTTVQSLGSVVTVSGGLSLAGVIHSAGPESLHVLEFQGSDTAQNLVVVPEPGTLILIGSGLVLAALSRLRRRAASAHLTLFEKVSNGRGAVKHGRAVVQKRRSSLQHGLALKSL